MSLIASLLPGVRELRTPFAVGAIWIAIGALLAFPSREVWLDWDAVDTAVGAFSMLPTAAHLAVLGFAVYIVGVATHALGGRVAGRIFAYSPFDYSVSERSAPTNLRRPGVAILWGSLKVKPLISNSIRERLSPNFPPLADAVPASLVLSEFDLAAMKLSKDSPEQYQQYDRVRAEGEFRLAICFPLLVLVACFAFMLPRWPGVLTAIVGIIFALVVLYEGIRHRQQADEYMASSIYFGHTDTPMFSALIAAADAELRKASEREQLAWLVEFLAARDPALLTGEFATKFFHPTRRDNFFETVWPLLSPTTQHKLESAVKVASSTVPADQSSPASARDSVAGRRRGQSKAS